MIVKNLATVRNKFEQRGENTQAIDEAVLLYQERCKILAENDKLMKLRRQRSKVIGTLKGGSEERTGVVAGIIDEVADCKARQE